MSLRWTSRKACIRTRRAAQQAAPSRPTTASPSPLFPAVSPLSTPTTSAHPRSLPAGSWMTGVQLVCCRASVPTLTPEPCRNCVPVPFLPICILPRPHRFMEAITGTCICRFAAACTSSSPANKHDFPFSPRFSYSRTTFSRLIVCDPYWHVARVRLLFRPSFG